MANIRIIPRFETWPQLKVLTCRLSGRIGIYFIFFVLFSFLQSDYLISSFLLTSQTWDFSTLFNLSTVVLTICLAICSFAGSHRPQALLLTTVLFILLNQSTADFFFHLIILAITLLFSLLLLKFQTSYVTKRPLQTLLTFLFIIIAITSLFKPNSLMTSWSWSFIQVFATYLWFIAYALSSLNQKNALSPVMNLSSLKPLWGGSNTPFGKNWAYLKRFESNTREDLSITHIKGIKLLIWVLCIRELHFLFSEVLCRKFQIPLYTDVFSLLVQGFPFPWYLGWISLLRDFLGNLFELTIWGGGFVICARMAGFRLLRNTVNPFKAKSIADFWNRYYYYFKELLVDFFFYPTFSRYFKKSPRMRLFFATFMAAGFGNFLYHFLRSITSIQTQGWLQTLWGFRTYALYCLILGVGIGISQFKSASHSKQNISFLRQGLLLTQILLFYCILQIFDLDNGNDDQLFNRFVFLGRLFGL